MLEAGQRGWSFDGLDTWCFVEDGVREGTQKEGRVGLADCVCTSISFHKL